MKLFIFCAIAVLYTVIGSNNLQGQQKSQSAIARMDIVSLSFAVTTRGAVTFDHLLKWTEKDGAFRTMFTDKSFLDSVDKRLHSLKLASADASKEDHRIACIIFREDGKVDKFGVNGLYFTLNGKTYQRDDSLFALIADRLPEDHRKVIYNFFIDKRKEIQRQKEAGTYKEATGDRVDIVSVNFNVLTRGAQTFDDLLTWKEKDGAFRTTITKQSFLDSVDERLYQLRPVSFDGSINHRIACLILRENGEVDKLGIGNLYFTLNGKYYQQDDKLFLLIADRLPEDHKKVIYEYVRKKKEIEQQKANGTYKEKIEDWEKEQDE